MAAPTIARGPVIGAPPTLEWVGVDRLHVDEAYQRATDTAQSRKIIVGMVKAWDWTLCQPLVVSRRDDGDLYVLDGQHRRAGAIERGDIPHLPCVVVSRIDQAGEARTFVELNTRRQRLSQGDIFNGMLAAGDADAKRVATILEETGWRHAHTSNTETYKPGDLFCGPRLTRELKANGEAALRNALATLREAYPEKPIRIASTLLTALIPIFRDNDLEGIDPDLSVETLGEVEPDDWPDFGRHEQQRSPALSRIEAIGMAMVNATRAAARRKAA